MMLTELKRRMNVQNENFNQENRKKKIYQTDITEKKTITDWKYIERGSAVDWMKQKTGSESCKIKRWHSPWQSSKKKKNLSEDNLKDHIKHNNICIIRIPEGEEKMEGAENLVEEIRAENVPNIWKETDM